LNAGVSTMKKTWMLTALAALSGSVGCGSQAGPDYEGEPLFTFGGKVVVQNPEAPGALVPAIAYLRQNEGTEAIFISEVSYEGTFPNDFRLKLFEPPPPEALKAIDDGEEDPLKDEPRVATGYVTAVPPGTPSILHYNSEFVSNSCWPLDPEAPDRTCTETWGRCRPGYFPDDLGDAESQCYMQEWTCAGDHDLARNGDREGCTLTRTYGNVEYTKHIDEKFGGLSRNVMLLYLDAPAAAGTYVSYWYNQGRAMNAGYNLVRWEQAPVEENDAFSSCLAQAKQEMLTSYNEANGTEHTEPHQLPGNDVRRYRDLYETMEGRGCPNLLYGGRIEVVDVDRETSVNIEIAPGEPPYDHFARAPR
jgi:hypothetical protein